jgi:hypothetical protein
LGTLFAGGWLQTALVPDAWNPAQLIKYVSSVIETNLGDLGEATSVAELFWTKPIMVFPCSLKLLKPQSIYDLNL